MGDHEDLDYEDKEMSKMAQGAYLLLSLKHQILSPEEAKNLEAMKYQFLSPMGLCPYTRPLRIQEPEHPKLREAAMNGGARRRNLPGEEQEEVEAEFQEGTFYGNYAPPDLPPVPSIQRLIEGALCSKPFEKQLTSSDVRDDQARLSMNKEDVEKHILPLLRDDEEPHRGVDVTIYDADGNRYPMVFKTWGAKIHVLTAGWKHFRMIRELEDKKDFVTLWVFRNVDNGSLCIVIISRRLPVSEPIKKRRRLRQN